MTFRDQIFISVFEDVLRNEAARLNRLRNDFGAGATPKTYTQLALIAVDGTAEVMSAVTKMSKSNDA